MPKWTREQEQAIKARNHTILVSAAAGSGKTAVLIERIVHLVRQGDRLNRMMIVTFTRAAAGEMRQRLNTRLTKEAAADPVVMGQALDDLEGTDISTIHAFCQRVIKTDFQAVGIDPMTRVSDEQQQQTLFEEAYHLAANELLDEENQDEQVVWLMQSFSQNELRDMCGELYKFLMSMPAPFAWMREKINGMDVSPFREHPWYRLLLARTKLELSGVTQYLDLQRKMFSDVNAVAALEATYQRDAQTVRQLLDACEAEPDKMMDHLAAVNIATAVKTSKLTEGETAWKEQFSDIRKKIKDVIKKCQEQLVIDEVQAEADLKIIQRTLSGLATLIEHIHRHFMALKNEKNVMDFSDMEQMTLEILSQPAFREDLQKEYDHIFVDECQDVSAVQNAIVQLIHGPNSCLFMVGDVKQSIYRFRLADPTLFLHRMRTFSDEEDAEERRIFLQKNFRSRANVLDAANRVFRSAMQRNVTELDYLPEDELIPGRETCDDPPVEIRLVADNGGMNAAEGLKSETAVVVRRIRELLETTFDDNGRERTYQYRDMVILLSKTAGIGAKLAELLSEQGIPVYFDGKDDYFGLPEIRTVKALLNVIDNPIQDVPLLTVLKMIPFSLTDSDLAKIRMMKSGKNVMFYEAFEAACEEMSEIGEKCRRIRAQIKEWQFRKEVMRLSDFIWFVIRESGFYASCGAYAEGELRQANLRLLCQRAAEYEQNFDGTLSGFLSMIDQQMQTTESRAAKVLGENENLVRIMTMHKSKGLEFPVVFCMRLSESLMGRSQGTLKMHNRLGLCLPYVNPEMSIQRDHPGNEAFKHQRKLDEMAERCRLLYVAMTRAREVLILTGVCKEQGALNWSMQRGENRVWQANGMMDWVMQSVLDDLLTHEMPLEAMDEGPWRVVLEKDVAWKVNNMEQRVDSTADWIQHVVDVPVNQEWCEWWKHVNDRREVKPIKTSVSSLARRLVLNDPMPMGDEDETIDDKREAEEIIAPLRMSELPSKPAFMEQRKMTGAERGTLMHHFLSLVPLAQVRGLKGHELIDAVYRAAGEMIDQGCFERSELNVLDFSDLSAYFASSIGQRMLASEEVHREWSFNLQISRRDHTLLQGIIDCAFMENGKWVLVDYKTDRIDSEEAFIERHTMQLSWYARALEQITGREVGEIWLYSLSRSKPYQVQRISLPEEM